MKLGDYIGLRKIEAGGPGSGRHPGECAGGECNKHPVEAYGARGMKSTQWRKTFKSTDHLNDWAEKNNADVHGTRFLSDAEIPSNWKYAGYHEAPK